MAGYEDQFMKDYRRFSNLSSGYYKAGYQNLLKSLNASSPTTNTLLSVPASQGLSYGGSMTIANRQRRGVETRNAETASSGLLDMYLRGQSLAQNSLQGAQQAYQYEDSKPSFLEEIAGFAAGGLLQGALGGGLGSLFKKSPNTSGVPGMSGNEWQLRNNAPSGPLKYVNTPEYRPLNYEGY